MTLDQYGPKNSLEGPPTTELRKALDAIGYPWEGISWTVDMPEGMRTITLDDLLTYCDTITPEHYRISFRLPTRLMQAKDPEQKIKQALLSLVRDAADHGFGFIGSPNTSAGAPEGEESEEEPLAGVEIQTNVVAPLSKMPAAKAGEVDTEGTFMARRQKKREEHHEKLHKMVHGELKIGAPGDGMPDSTYASEILRDTLEEVGIPEDKYQWVIPLPGLSRMVMVSDLADYCDTQPEEKVIEACKVPEDWSTDDPVTEMVGRLYTLAEAAAKAGFGEAHVPLGDDGQPIPPEPRPFDVGKKYETIGEKVGKKYETAGLLGEAIGKDVGKQYETIGEGIGKNYEKTGEKGKNITKKVERYGKDIGKDMERKIKQLNKKYETMGDKFRKFEQDTAPEIPAGKTALIVTRNSNPPAPRVCPGCATLLMDKASKRCPICGARLGRFGG